MARFVPSGPSLLLMMAFAMNSCGGGGASRSTPQTAPVSNPQGSPGADGADVQVMISLPGSASAAKARKPAFVSPGAAGLSLAVYLSSDTAHSSPVATSIVAIGAGQAGCSSSAPVSCVLSLDIPASPADDFVATIYDTAPVNGAFPAAAQVLGVGSAAKVPITPNTQNAITLSVRGVPFSAVIAYSQDINPIVGRSATYPLTVNALDASSQSIHGTYATPLQLTSTNANVVSFLVNGSPGTTIAASTDTVAVSYNGALGAATLSLTGIAPFTATALSFSPTRVPPVATPDSINLYPSLQSATFTVTEPYNGGGYAQTNTCGTYATVTPSSATSDSAIFTVTAGFVPSYASCTVTVQDRIGQSVSVSVSVINDS